FCMLKARIFYRTLAQHSRRLIDTCPSPKVDTGCTYCELKYPEDLPIDTTRPLAGTAPEHYRHIV
ncbi:hypothetical protein CANCADRAFT_19340, partial [Tortispora caseinolytica NRRL Y-17796]